MYEERVRQDVVIHAKERFKFALFCSSCQRKKMIDSSLRKKQETHVFLDLCS